jgi:glycosyltransferase involved in cell wall biosynthesis
MKVLIVSQYFWPENFRINDLATGLIERGHEVSVITGQPNYPHGVFFKGYNFFSPVRETYGRVRIFRVPVIPRGKGSGARLALNYLSFAFFGCLLGPWLYREKPDLILTFQTSPITAAFPALLLRALRKAPSVMWVQDLWPESLAAAGEIRSPLILKLVGAMVRKVYQHCDLLLMQSEAFRTSMLKHGADAERLRYVPNFAEDLFLAQPSPPPPPECAQIPVGFRIMFAGNVGAAQDFETLLTAATLTRSRPDIHWLIVGEGRQLPWVREQIKSRGLESTVHLVGAFPVERMPEFFSFADVMLATLRDEPIFALTVPSKIQAYLAYGKPILAALNGEGARIIAKANAGICVPAGHPEKLAAAALAFAALPRSELTAMSERGRALFAQEFSRSRVLGDFESLFCEAVRKTP